LQGEHRYDICRDLNRTFPWFDKGWAEYRPVPQTDFADHSRAPHASPQTIPPTVAQAVVSIRQTLEAANTPETKDGLIGNRAIRGALERLIGA
jgi:hypothetical protein